MWIAGDIGGTNARLGLFGRGETRPELLQTHVYPTSAFPDEVGLLLAFCQDYGIDRRSLQGAAFGVAGPVLDNVVTLTNANWRIDGRATARALGLREVRIINDLAAMAWGVTALRPGESVALQDVAPDPRGNVAIIAPGTGLGEGLLHNEAGILCPSPSEGGHADLAARTPRELELVQFVTAQSGRASWEHVLCGPGLVTLHAFTHDGPCPSVDIHQPDAPAQISTSALAGTCAACAEALNLFVSLLGAEAGNLALRTVSTGGLFLGGGIPPRILPALQDGRFMEAFLKKEPARALVERIPVRVITHPYPGLMGAAVVASQTGLATPAERR